MKITTTMCSADLDYLLLIKAKEERGGKRSASSKYAASIL